MPRASGLYLNLEILDHLVGEQLAAHFLDLSTRLGGILLGEFQLDELALAHFLDASKAQGCQRMLYCLALGVEHTVLQGDMHARFHIARYLRSGAGKIERRLAFDTSSFNDEQVTLGRSCAKRQNNAKRFTGVNGGPPCRLLSRRLVESLRAKDLPPFHQRIAQMSLYSSTLLDPHVKAPSWWEESASVHPPACPALEEDAFCDAAVIGGGYTGLSAALHLQRDHHLSVRVLEAGQPGWGASGRNGGFCCIGGAKLSYQAMIDRFGLEETQGFFKVQQEAIETVAAMAEQGLVNLGASGQVGEICLAHRPRRAAGLQQEAEFLRHTFGIEAEWKSPEQLAEEGMRSSLHGGLFLPFGFGLHPLTYARSLARAAQQCGATLHGDSEVIAWSREGKHHRLHTSRGTLRAKRVILATNGYSREALVPAQAGRLLPVLSNILVTRQLSEEELQAQGWSSTRLAYDSRDLLHYFRLLPNGRFLFGGRGGVSGTAADVARQRAWMERCFRSFFPAWGEVGFTHFWNGLACLAADRLPHVAELPDTPGAFTAFAYHGNGVALATWAGRAVAALAAGKDPQLPAPLRQVPPRFFLPALRLHYLRAAYLGYRLRDEYF